MMPFPKYSDTIATRPERPYPSGGSLTQRSLPMPKRIPAEQGSSGTTPKPFVTIDDCIETAEALVQRLSQLGALKYPLDVRKGVRVPMPNNEPSRTVKAATRTYFFDVRTGKDGRRYLNVTESRIKDQQRAQITVFPEEAQAFV